MRHDEGVGIRPPMGLKSSKNTSDSVKRDENISSFETVPRNYSAKMLF